MVAKKTPTPAWGEASKAETKPADDLEIPEFLRRDSEPQQMDIEDFTKEPATSPAGDEAPQQMSHAAAEPPHDPETGEVSEESVQTSDTEWEAAAPKPQPSTPIPDVPMAGANANRALIGFVERIERVNEEISALQDDRKEIFAEMKAEGFNVSIVREVLRRRKMDPDAREEHDSLLEIYEESLR